MRRSPKIILACIIAVLFVSGATFSAFKQPKSTYTAQGSLSGTDEGWVAPVDILASATSTYPIDTNQTDVLSKQLFSNFIVLRQSGNLNSETADSLANQLSTQAINNAPKAKVYTKADLHIITNATKEDIKKYGNEFFILRNNYQNAYIVSLTSPGSPILDKTESGTTETFAIISGLYNKLVPDLLKMSVPVDLASLHLEIINNYAGSAYGLKQFGALNVDPMAAIVGLNTFGQNSNLEALILKKIGAYFIKSGIIFSVDEPGHGWDNI